MEADPRLDKLFRRAARKAQIEWLRDSEAPDDLVNDIWVWYLETPSTREKFRFLADGEIVESVRLYAMSLLSRQTLEGNVTSGDALYSSEMVKDVLKGRSTNRYLKSILPAALRRLEARYAPYREAIRERYDDGTIPIARSDVDRLIQAHKALTQEVNALVITVDIDSGRMKDAVDPETRRSSAERGYSDPTGDSAVDLALRGDQEIDIWDATKQAVEKTTARELFYGLSSINEELGVPMYEESDDSSAANDHSIFDGTFNGMPGAEMYRAWVQPELFPGQPQPRLSNWDPENLVAYVGGEYTPRPERKAA